MHLFEGNICTLSGRAILEHGQPVAKLEKRLAVVIWYDGRTEDVSRGDLHCSPRAFDWEMI